MAEGDGLPWFRMYSNIVDNHKIRMLAFEDRWHFVAILACHCQGLLKGEPQFIERTVSVKLGVQLRELEEIKRRLMEVNLIDDNFTPTGWDDRQFKSDSGRERLRKFREKQKQKKGETVLKRFSNVSETAQDTDTDTDTDTEQINITARVMALGIDKGLWNEYIKTRKRLKATNTPRGLKTLLNRIEKFVSQGRCATSMIEEANAQGWKTVYEPKGDTNVSKSALAILNHTDW